MLLVDTSAWVDWLAGSAAGGRIGAMLPPRGQWLVPTIVQLELMKWLLREEGEDAADQVAAYTQRCVIAPLSTRIALAAADLCHTCKLATADAIVYATAQEHGASLLTCDAHFKGLPGVEFVAKSKA